MSALGQKSRFGRSGSMSAITPKATAIATCGPIAKRAPLQSILGFWRPVL